MTVQCEHVLMHILYEGGVRVCEFECSNITYLNWWSRYLCSLYSRYICSSVFLYYYSRENISVGVLDEHLTTNDECVIA